MPHLVSNIKIIKKQALVERKSMVYKCGTLFSI